MATTTMTATTSEPPKDTDTPAAEAAPTAVRIARLLLRGRAADLLAAPTSYDLRDAGRLLTAADLRALLAALAVRMGAHFGHPATLVVHGGAVCVLALRSRATTRDIDFYGVHFARQVEARGGGARGLQELEGIIEELGRERGLLRKWMNNDADDIMSLVRAEVDSEGEDSDDPAASKAAEQICNQNLECRADGISPERTIFDVVAEKSIAQRVVLHASRWLTVYAMSWPWAVVNKLHRCTDADRVDICSILRRVRRDREPAAALWRWLEDECPQHMAWWRPRGEIPRMRARVEEIAAALALARAERERVRPSLRLVGPVGAMGKENMGSRPDGEKHERVDVDRTFLEEACVA